MYVKVCLQACLHNLNGERYNFSLSLCFIKLTPVNGMKGRWLTFSGLSVSFSRKQFITISLIGILKISYFTILQIDSETTSLKGYIHHLTLKRLKTVLL